LGGPSRIWPFDRSTKDARTRDGPGTQVHITAAQRDRLAPPQAGERREQDQGAEPHVLVAVGAAVLDQLPKRPLCVSPCCVCLWGGAHLSIPAEPQPVATRRETADIADWAAPHPLG
jgi:hypothetical protein